MTTLVTADLHLAAGARDAYRFAFLEQTLPALVREHRARRVVVAGDLTEAKDGHRAPLVNRVADGIAALAGEVDVVVLKGNHDYLAADVPFYRFLGHVPRVRWINEPEELELCGLGECLFLPHTRDPSGWGDIALDDRDWIFCHQTFGGADLGGRKFEGDGPPFPRGSRVVSGDVHVPQRVGPVEYVGSPYTVDFGDRFEPRVLLLEGKKTRSVPVPGPQKRLVSVVGEWDERAMREHREIEPGDVVKVQVELPAGSGTPLAEVRAAVHSWAGSVGADLYAVRVTRAGGGRESATAARRRPARSDEHLVRMYVKRMGAGRATAAAGLKIADEIT